MTPLDWLGRLALYGAFAAAVMATYWHFAGALGLIYAVPVLSILSQPLVEVIASLPGLAARLVLRKVEGRYYEFRGRSMDIHIDDEARCWVSTADVRKIVALPADAVLQRMLPRQCAELGDPLRWRITPEGMAQFLALSTDPEATRFCRWLQGQVARPAHRKLERGMTLR